jgi:hypothetical protein
VIGRRRFDVDFPGGMPLPLKATIGIGIANFAASFGLSEWACTWAPRVASATYSYPVHFRGGKVAFVPPQIGHYIEWAFWSHFVLLAVAALLTWFYERTNRAIVTPRD